MRFEGRLEKWNDDRGFGFIAPSHGGEPVFVHVSAFPRDGQRPKSGESLTFAVEAGADGRKRAIRVQRPGPRPSASADVRPARRGEPGGGGGLALRGIVVALILVVGGYAYTRFSGSGAENSWSAPTGLGGPARSLSSDPPAAAFRCDGRIHCSQMASCEEAKFFLRNCPGTKMDGDNDGVPCEAQWCGGR
jgi:cold shock CspA family protein